MAKDLVNLKLELDNQIKACFKTTQQKKIVILIIISNFQKEKILKLEIESLTENVKSLSIKNVLFFNHNFLSTTFLN